MQFILIQVLIKLCHSVPLFNQLIVYYIIVLSSISAVTDKYFVTLNFSYVYIGSRRIREKMITVNSPRLLVTIYAVAPTVAYLICNLKGQWQRQFLLAISILLDDQTMKILSFPSRTF